MIYVSKPSPELPLAGAQTQPSYENVIENEEDEESGDLVLETNIGQFASEDVLTILEKMNSIVNVDVLFENSGEEELSNAEKEIYNEEYGDEEFKASMDTVQLPVATIIKNNQNYNTINDLEINLDDRSVRSSNIFASFWDFGFIFTMQRAFENHVHRRFLDPDQCFLLCETKGCNAFSVLSEGLQIRNANSRNSEKSRSDFFSFSYLVKLIFEQNLEPFSEALNQQDATFFSFPVLKKFRKLKTKWDFLSICGRRNRVANFPHLIAPSSAKLSSSSDIMFFKFCNFS